MADKGWLSAWNLYWTSGSTFLYTQPSLEQRPFQDSLRTALPFSIQLEDSHSIFCFHSKNCSRHKESKHRYCHCVRRLSNGSIKEHIEHENVFLKSDFLCFWVYKQQYTMLPLNVMCILSAFLWIQSILNYVQITWFECLTCSFWDATCHRIEISWSQASFRIQDQPWLL